MNIDRTKEREPLGLKLANLEDWNRTKIRKRLSLLGVTQGKWKRILTTAKAYDLPPYIRDVIVEELPETADLFNHPNLKPESIS